MVGSAFDIRELSPAAFPHAVTHLRVVETHISWIVLTGHYAYKIKKPVHYDFLDARTLDQRRELCAEELRLNQRLAPHLYLDVLPVTREHGELHIGGSGPAIEYAVRMHEFDPTQELSSQLDAGVVTPEDLTSLATSLADFHRDAAIASPDSAFGEVAAVRGQILDNLPVLEQHFAAPEDLASIRHLDDWLQRSLTEAAPLIAQRKRGGNVRECHGDLHARNIVRWRRKWLPFDCIEFNPDLRWIDVMSDVAFLFMDLAAHDRQDLAHVFLSGYMEETGDYEGLRLLPLYAVYRALVRAKIDALAAQSVSAESAQALNARGLRRIRVAAELISGRRPALLITHGVTACGKSWLSERLIPTIQAVRVRSDLERKRLAGLQPLEHSGSGVGEKLYTAELTDHVYGRLGECAKAVLDAGFKVVVDASFLRATERDRFRELAQERGIPFIILACHANLAALHARLETRARVGFDPSEATRAVLEHQLATQEELTPREREHAVTIDTNWLISTDAGIKAVQARLDAAPPGHGGSTAAS